MKLFWESRILLWHMWYFFLSLPFFVLISVSVSLAHTANSHPWNTKLLLKIFVGSAFFPKCYSVCTASSLVDLGAGKYMLYELRLGATFMIVSWLIFHEKNLLLKKWRADCRVNLSINKLNIMVIIGKFYVSLAHTNDHSSKCFRLLTHLNVQWFYRVVLLFGR